MLIASAGFFPCDCVHLSVSEPFTAEMSVPSLFWALADTGLCMGV